MASVPSFIFTVLNKELFEIQSELLQRVALDHGLDATELVKKYLADPITIVPNAKTKVEIVKRVDPKPPPEAEKRCMARVWNRGRGGQCSRARTTESDLCTHHQNGTLRHGRIDEKPPTHVFGGGATARQKALYK